jgi:hypothetical protein
MLGCGLRQVNLAWRRRLVRSHPRRRLGVKDTRAIVLLLFPHGINRELATLTPFFCQCSRGVASLGFANPARPGTPVLPGDARAYISSRDADAP